MPIKKESKRLVVNLDKDIVWGTHVVGSEAYGADTITPPSENDQSIDDSGAFGSDGLASCVIKIKDLGGEATVGSYAYYDQLGPWIIPFFGGYDYANVVAGVKKHRFAMLASIDAELDNLVHSFALEEGRQIKKWNGVGQETMLSIADGAFKVESTWLCDYTSVSIANLSAATLLGNCQVMKFPSTTVWLNAADGADFGNGDKIKVTDLQIGVMRGLETQDAENGDTYPAIPLEITTGRPQLTVMLKFQRKLDAYEAYRTDFIAKVDYKMKIEVIGNVIDSPHTYKFTLLIPRITFQTGVAPEYAVDSPTSVTLNLMTLKAATPPTGMDYELPYGDLINTHAAYDYNLAAGTEGWAL
jgi:hypothetical protein